MGGLLSVNKALEVYLGMFATEIGLMTYAKLLL